MNLLIFAVGGYDWLAKEIAELTKKFEQIDFLDDAYKGAIGKLSDLKLVQKNYNGCVVAIGNPKLENRFLGEIDKAITLEHSKVEISRSALIGNGCVNEANAVISTEAVVKDCS